MNRVKAVEKEKDDLEGTKNEAVQFLMIENHIAKKQNILNQLYVSVVLLLTPLFYVINLALHNSLLRKEPHDYLVKQG